MAARLTTTSYCLLGLLRLGPTSAYDLTKYLQRSALSYLWPRTEAAIYRETRQLAAAGLTDASTEQNGERRRSVYRITPAGAQALDAWLQEPGAGGRFECEAAVKAFFGDATGLSSLRRQLTALVTDFEDEARRMEPVVERWLAGELQFPDRVHYTAMSADLIARLQLATKEWASAWLERVDRWDGTGVDDAKRDEAHEVIAGIRARIDATSAQPGKPMGQETPVPPMPQ